jgi:hypothetical protein
MLLLQALNDDIKIQLFRVLEEKLSRVAKITLRRRSEESESGQSSTADGPTGLITLNDATLLAESLIGNPNTSDQSQR